jgi:hypothetical protein
LFVFSTLVLIRHLWQLKMFVFLHWCLICTVLLFQIINSKKFAWWRSVVQRRVKASWCRSNGFFIVTESIGLYHKHITIIKDSSRVVRMMIVSDAMSWSNTYDCNWWHQRRLQKGLIKHLDCRQHLWSSKYIYSTGHRVR